MENKSNRNQHRYTSSRLTHIITSLPYAFLSLFSKRDKKLIVFCGMHCDCFNSNSKHLFLYFLKNEPDYTVKFVINDDEKRAALIEQYGEHFIDTRTKEGKKLDSLIEKLPPLVEEGEYRFKISGEDFKEYGNKVLEEFKARAKASGYTMPQSYEGVRLSFKSEEVQGWILLRLSLHDPVMPLNIEGGRKGDLAKLVEIARKLTDGFDRLDRSCLK